MFMFGIFRWRHSKTYRTALSCDAATHCRPGRQTRFRACPQYGGKKSGVPAQKTGTGTPLPVPFSTDRRAGTAGEWQSLAFGSSVAGCPTRVPMGARASRPHIRIVNHGQDARATKNQTPMQRVKAGEFSTGGTPAFAKTMAGKWINGMERKTGIRSIRFILSKNTSFRAGVRLRARARGAGVLCGEWFYLR